MANPTVKVRIAGETALEHEELESVSSWVWALIAASMFCNGIFPSPAPTMSYCKALRTLRGIQFHHHVMQLYQSGIYVTQRNFEHGLATNHWYFIHIDLCIDCVAGF